MCSHEGMAPEDTREALQEQMQKGTSFGAPSALENVLAKMVIEAGALCESRGTAVSSHSCQGRSVRGDGALHQQRHRGHSRSLHASVRE